MEGRVTIAQESRFQLVDERGAVHLFLLGHSAAAEPQQLARLQAEQSRVEVRYTEPHNIIGLVAHDIRFAPKRRRLRALLPWT